MRVAVFTSNQPRHLALLEALARVADRVYAVQECNTVCPGTRPDFFAASDVMRDYFGQVLAAERRLFGVPRFLPARVRQLAVRMGDLERLDLGSLAPALEADAHVVFGASWIRGPLCDALVERGAVNLHMGASPWYRGSSTNFWALYDRRPQYVAATIHLLTPGLDSGPILFHALPRAEAIDPFLLGMRAVQAAQTALVERLADGELRRMTPVAQDRSRELRYSRNSDFTDDVAREYLERLPAPADVHAALKHRDLADFVRPCVG